MLRELLLRQFPRDIVIHSLPNSGDAFEISFVLNFTNGFTHEHFTELLYGFNDVYDNLIIHVRENISNN